MDTTYNADLKEELTFFWDWDIESGTEYMCPAFKSMLGYKDEEITNKPEAWQGLVVQEDLQKHTENLEQHISSKAAHPYNTSLRFKHGNGDIIWLSRTGHIVEWSGSKPKRMIGCFVNISKQKEAEQKLIESTRFFRKTSEAARVGGWEVDLIENTVKWTSVTKKIHEVDSDYIPTVETGINFYKSGETRNKITTAFTDLVQKGIPFDLELQIITAKGNEIWVRSIGNVDIVDGKYVKAYGVFQDIDYRKKIQDQLKQSEQRFRESFENSAIGMALVAPDGRWLKVNKQVCEITGYPEKELLTKTFQDITHPDDLDLDLDNLQSLIEGRISSYQMEKRYYHKYGHIVWVLLSVSIVRSANGSTQHFVSQIEDITKNKEAEEQLSKVNRELTALFESITQVSVITTDVNGIIKHFSRGSETLLGYKAEEMVNKQTPALIHSEEEVIERGKELSKEFGHPVEGFDVFVIHAKNGTYNSSEWTYIRKDGSTFPVQLVVTAMHDNNNEISGFLGIATDISSIKQTEEQLKTSIEIVSEQNTRLFNFAHIVSHNLRSHTGNLALLLDLYKNASDPQEQQDLINHLQGVSDNLSETIVHLNEVVTIQTNITQQRKKLNLLEYVEKTKETLAGDISQSEVDIECNIPEDVHIMYNEAYLESILLNFISNAIKYRNKEVKPKITLNYNNINNSRILEIVDNGIGINLERYGKKLFGMYKTFHGNEDAKGIGLFITKNQIEAMGGKIEVKSTLGKGTTFIIHF